MKIFKRNAIIITVILFVCVAVYLNWSYNKKGVINDETMAASELTESENTTDSESGLFFDESENNEAEAALGTTISAERTNSPHARDDRQQA
jgi:stage III sporulation protein AH